jgi:TPR repeat protein
VFHWAELSWKEGPEANRTEAMFYNRQAADCRHLKGILKYAQYLLEKVGDDDVAIRYYKIVARKLLLNARYEFCRLITIPWKSVYFYKLAADAGHIQAQYNYVAQ